MGVELRWKFVVVSWRKVLPEEKLGRLNRQRAGEDNLPSKIIHSNRPNKDAIPVYLSSTAHE